MTIWWPEIAGTGHRPEQLPADIEPWAIQAAEIMLRSLVDHHGLRLVHSGMSRGWDMWLALASWRAGVPFRAHIPFPQQPLKWSRRDQDRYHWLLDRAADTTIYHQRYNVAAYHERDGAMVRLAHAAGGAVATLHDPARHTGGTWETLRKVPAGMPVIRLDPIRRTTTWPATEYTPETLFTE